VNQAHQIGELGGVLRLAFFQAEIPTIVIPPTKVKMFATGSGKGKKEGPLAEAIRRLEYGGSKHDEADALWLLQMALTHYELPGAISLPKSHTRALVGVDWPPAELPFA
jgi:Holliday junction resolvasome RuvABC endonuclease subunit